MKAFPLYGILADILKLIFKLRAEEVLVGSEILALLELLPCRLDLFGLCGQIENSYAAGIVDGVDDGHMS